MPKPPPENASTGFASRRFGLAFLVAGLFFSGLILAIYRQDVVNQGILLSKEAQHVLDLQQKLLLYELRGVESDLLFLANQDLLQKFLQDRKTSRKALEQEYEIFAVHKGVYDQIRFLDVRGLEQVRINYLTGTTEIVPPDELQSKEARFYFQQALPLGKGEVFISPFDLNVEHGKLEQPIEPVIRFVTPVFDQSNQKQGFLVLNYLGTPLLEKLRQISASFRGETMLVNPAGDYLQAPDSSHEWGWLLGHPHSFSQEFPDAWQLGKKLRAGTFRVMDDVFAFQSLSPGVRLPVADNQSPTTTESEELSELVLISRVSASVANAYSKELLNQLLLMFAGVMVAVGLLAFYWAHSADIQQRHEIQIAASESRLRQLSSDLLETQESERRNLSRVLHDELGQLATAIRLDLGSLQRQLSPSESSELLHRVIGETDDLLQQLHKIASNARPSVLDDLGLKEALESFFSEYQQRTGIAVISNLVFDQKTIPTKIGENAYRIVGEALSNVARHAETGEVELHMENDDKLFRIVVEDSGVGFRSEDLEASTRLGILGMRERAELLNGTFKLSSSPGEGTRIAVEIPLGNRTASRSDPGTY